MNVILI
jgi:hypothetical protein